MGTRITAHIRTNVIGYLALVVALSGTAYAAGKINGKQIKQNSIPANRLTKSARTSLRGQQGPPGQQGPSGQQGPPGQNGATNVVVRTHVITSGGSVLGEAACDAGERALSGGVAKSNGGIISSDVILGSYPETALGAGPAPAGATPTAWKAGILINSSESLTFYVICASP
jgi:hypothetical protein